MLNKYKILKYTSIPFIIREVFQRNRVTILLYHDLSPQNAKEHFSYLKKNYNIISLQKFIDALLQKNFESLPPKSLIITFDDGHKGNYKLLPIIKEFEIPVTIFLCSHIINTRRHYWFKWVSDAKTLEKLKLLQLDVRLDRLKEAGFEQLREFGEPMALNKEEIEEMKTHVDFQSHTMFHPCLPTCTDEESESEITESKNKLERDYNFRINTLSYPNGDYSDREITFLKKHGYAAGITCDLWFNSKKTDLFRLKRVDCNDDADLDELEVKVTGIYHFLKRLIFGKPFGYRKTL